MQEKIYNLTAQDFIKAFGARLNDFSSVCHRIIQKSNFHYKQVPPEKQTVILDEIKKNIDSNKFSMAGESKRSFWNDKWSDQLKNFTTKKQKIDALVPKYFIKPMSRFNGGFIIPLKNDFEINWSRVYKYWLFKKYFQNVDNIYEFGGGTGMNMPILADLFPQKKFYCSDWVESAVEIYNLMAKKFKWNLSGFVFDMFRPNYSLEVPKKSAFLTFSSLEQLGRNYRDFIEFAIQKKVDLFVTVDSIEELYGKTKYDNLARKFIIKRNYLKSYLTFLRNLEEKGRIKIIKIQRIRFGNLYHDGYSYIVWKPIKN